MQSKLSRPSHSLKNKHLKLQIPKYTRNTSLQKVSFSSRRTHSFENNIIIPSNSGFKRTPHLQSATFSPRIKNSCNKLSFSSKVDDNVKQQEYDPTPHKVERDSGAWNLHLLNQNNNYMW